MARQVFILPVITGRVEAVAAAAAIRKLQIFPQLPGHPYLMLLVRAALLERLRVTAALEQQQLLIAALIPLAEVEAVLVQQPQHQLEEQAGQVLHIMAGMVAQEVLLQLPQLVLAAAAVAVQVDQMA